NRSLALTLFPNLARLLPASSLAGLLAISRLVGMECPGLRSILSGFGVTFSSSPPAGTEPMLSFRVIRRDARFSLITLNISVEEIEATGGRCGVLACDVLDPEPFRARLAGAGVVPSHLYFFATPKIFLGKSEVYDRQVFRRFAAVYLDGFFGVYQACRTVSAD